MTRVEPDGGTPVLVQAMLTVVEPVLRCRMYGLFPYMWLGMVVLFTFVFGPIAIIAALNGGENSPGAGIVLWYAVLGWFWFVALWLFSYEIRLYADGTLEFKAVLRTTRVNVGDIERVGPWLGGFDPQTLVIRTRRGTAHILRQMTNMFDLATRLRELNPSIDLSRF